MGRKYSIFEFLIYNMKIAIIGATGMVGKEILEVLSKYNLPVSQLILVASERSLNQKMVFNGKQINIQPLNENLLNQNIDIALFSAGSEISKKWAPRFSNIGCKVVDNSSYWRMSDKHKLIIPEINGEQLSKSDMIIANPNCSTIQLLMVLSPLHKKYIAKRVILSTYQAVSGTGKKAVDQLKKEYKDIIAEKAYPHKISQNIIPHCDDFTENGYTKEEMKLTNETKKILDKNIDVVATAVRVPVIRGHSESVNIEFDKDFETEKLKEYLQKSQGVVVLDDPQKNIYPMPLKTEKKDEVFVGRIRRDFTKKKCVQLWIVADNLRKGAATNTVQIAEYIIKNKLL